MNCARCLRGFWDGKKIRKQEELAITVYNGEALCRKHVQEEWGMEDSWNTYSPTDYKKT